VAASGYAEGVSPIALIALVAAPLFLDVPFVAQRTNGCAAAALTMVLRYWGDPAPETELAGALPGPSARGLAGSRLAELARKRGHQAIAYEGDLPHLREYLAKGRPLIVALRSGRDRYHDVVVVGFDDQAQEVVVHDPESGPTRRLAARTFEERWGGAGHWTLLVLPARP
jgi:ABC-type bacteriocin/lantibiotic exporter with double-glycine peptidase domain